MKKKILIVLLGVFLLLGLVGCKNNNTDENTSKELVGTIKEIKLDYYKSSDKDDINYLMPNYILLENNNNNFIVHFGDDLNLEVGMQIKVTFDGNVLTSNPPQIIPQNIEIIK